jgi:predicted SnoaL-like aldol condensation-catalyzing enzyme
MPLLGAPDMLCSSMETAVRRLEMEGERNTEALRRLIEDGFGKGELAVVDEVVDEGLEEHQPGIAPAKPEGVKRAIRFLHTAFPDFRVTVQHTVSDGDLAWCHFTAEGTHLGPFGRMPATGRTMRIDVIDIARFRDGKLVEHWGVPDRLSQLEQLGLLPQRQEVAGK